MSLYFAISGGQLSGKTTLCHRIVSDLKAASINAGYSDEAVRLSYLMFKGQRNQKMHLESLLVQIQREILAGEHYDVVICDRSAIDYLAFANLRFPNEINSIHLNSVRALVTEYSSIYSEVFVTNGSQGVDPGDPLRIGEDTTPEHVSLEVARLCNELRVPWRFVKAFDEIGERQSQHSLSDLILDRYRATKL